MKNKTKSIMEIIFVLSLPFQYYTNEGCELAEIIQSRKMASKSAGVSL